MATSLSDDEFQRLQMQILELRTENYTLEDRCKRQERELTSFKQELQTHEKELQRATKAVSKSKKAKEVEQLLQENEVLQNKLFGQEDDFRIQNETIMKELGQVMEQNEKLEKELKDLKESSGDPQAQESDSAETLDELRHLQAQNTALQKNLASLQENHEKEVLSLQQTISNLESQAKKLAAQRGNPVGENSEGRQVEGQSDQESSEEESFEKVDVTDGSYENPPSQTEDKVEESTINSIHSHTTDDLSKQISDLKLQLDTEAEEKKLIKDQLQSLEKSSKEEHQTLQDEVQKLTEKFKKKQESFVHLQEEKEAMFSKLSAQIESLEKAKETEAKKWSSQAESLQSELAMCNKTLEELQKSSDEKISSLEAQITDIQDQKKVDEATNGKTQAYIEEIDSLKKACRDWEQNTVALKQNVEDLATQLQASKVAHQSCIEAQNALQEDRDKQISALQEMNRVAEKRKALLDELAIKYQTSSDQHREAIKAMEQSHKEEIEKLSAQVSDLEKRLKQYSHIEEKLEESKTQLSSLEETKGWLERRLKEVEENLATAKSEHEKEVSKMELKYEDELATLRTESNEATRNLEQKHAQDKQEFQNKIEGMEKALEEKQNKISHLQQEIKDGQDAKKTHEKKGMTMVKDLKKQLVAERKRADKLQERLQEYLQSDTRSRSSVDELLRNDGADRYHGDDSSVGSWSAAASGLSRDGASSSTVQSPEDETLPSVGSATVDQEHQELLHKVAQLQEEKWTLEEKVSHLESSNAAMCEDLLSKTSIIEHYVMNSKTGNIPSSSSQSEKLSLKRVMDFVTDKESDDMREMNRKLQTMLEETLTKNMHLQQNMEDMSLELVRLSKQGLPPEPVKQPNK